MKPKYVIMFLFIALFVAYFSITSYSFVADHAFLSQKVGCCLDSFDEDQSACIVLEESCTNYQKFVTLPGGIPMPYGCEAGAKWDEGCNPYTNRWATGDKVETGLLTREVDCPFKRDWGDCRSNLWLICVKKNTAHELCGKRKVIDFCSDS